MTFGPPFCHNTYINLIIQGADFLYLRYWEDEIINKIYLFWGENSAVETFNDIGKFWSQNLNWSYKEGLGFLDQVLDVMEEQMKKRPVDMLNVTVNNAEGNRLLAQELRKRRISVPLLRFTRFDNSEESNDIIQLIEHRWYVGLDSKKEQQFIVTKEMLSKEFLALDHHLSNPECLDEFKGWGLAINAGITNSHDYYYVFDYFKRWIDGENLPLKYLQISKGGVPSVDVIFSLEDEAKEVFYGESTADGPDISYRFERRDGQVSQFIIKRDHVVWMVDPDDSKRAFFRTFSRSKFPDSVKIIMAGPPQDEEEVILPY